MKKFLLALAHALFVITFFNVGAAGAENQNSLPVTIEIKGKFLDGCTSPGNLKVALHNVDNTWWKDLKVTDGAFSFRHTLTEPRRVALRTQFGNKFDFFVTPDEKVYEIDITCSGRTENFEVKNSPENKAYIPFSLANKQHQEDLDALGKNDVSQKENFQQIQKTIIAYQKKLADIAAAYPNTFTAKMFCAAEQLPQHALNSPEAIEQNFLYRQQFSDPHFYNDFLPQRILLNYIAIRDKSKSDPNEVVEKLMAIVAGNTEAAKRLQENMSNLFFRMYQEDLFIAYINWAEKNSDKMYNLSVKQRLQNLKKVMAGNEMTDFALNDPSGRSRKLSETVRSGKLTVLIFYSPTCGHCKQKVPQLIPLWEKYSSKGLKIFAVASDASTDEWSSFITSHAKPEWVHVYKGEGANAADQYHASNPTFVMIDEQGKIISRIGDFDFVLSEIERRLN